MPRLNTPILFETTFGAYRADELIGEGGAGRVYGGTDAEAAPVAIKVLARDRATADRRRRFKNEIAFLDRRSHPSLVKVIDHGIATGPETGGPFYVMRRYDGSLRDPMRAGLQPAEAMRLFSLVLDGVEAAHLHGAVHRDLKPENILYEGSSGTIAIADFGVASFTDDVVVTLVETSPDQRLANFQYAAPEQRVRGAGVGRPADIYALGLILNEMFTGNVPHGTGYRLIGQVAADFAYLDEIVERMLRQGPQERPDSINAVKMEIQRRQADVVSLQKLSKIDGAVIKSAEIDEPLAEVPPRLVDYDWNNGQLELILDRTVNQQWVNALQNMGAYKSLMGKGPDRFFFRGNRAVIQATEHEVQQLIDYFKEWLPAGTRKLKASLEEDARQAEARQREALYREREAEEQRLRIRRNVRL